MNIPKFAQRTRNMEAQHRHSHFSMFFFTPHEDEEIRRLTAEQLVRKNQAQMTKLEKDLFIEGIEILINMGEYGTFASYHANMDHNMHGNPRMPRPQVGAQRFLPWHRAYLFELEQKLRAWNPSVYIPYWDWTIDRDIPEWLKSFTPTVVINGIPRNPQRKPGLDPTANKLPPATDIDIVKQQQTFTKFTDALEGWKFRTFGLETDTHNRVHRWIGGIMATSLSPVDILFWLHHANIDRIWSQWQENHQNLHPSLNGNDTIMDPWTYHESELRKISDLGYVYDT
jgi:tyrosinase